VLHSTGLLASTSIVLQSFEFILAWGFGDNLELRIWLRFEDINEDNLRIWDWWFNQDWWRIKTLKTLKNMLLLNWRKLPLHSVIQYSSSHSHFSINSKLICEILTSYIAMFL
jgi:hypothetical protein